MRSEVVAKAAAEFAEASGHVTDQRLRFHRKINRVVAAVTALGAPVLLVLGLWLDWRFLVLAVACSFLRYTRNMAVAVADIELHRRAEEWVEHEVSWVKGAYNEARSLLSDAIERELITEDEWIDETNVALGREYGSDAPWSPTIWGWF